MNDVNITNQIKQKNKLKIKILKKSINKKEKKQKLKTLKKIE